MLRVSVTGHGAPGDPAALIEAQRGYWDAR
jgi:hypothetical protein